MSAPAVMHNSARHHAELEFTVLSFVGHPSEKYGWCTAGMLREIDGDQQAPSALLDRLASVTDEDLERAARELMVRLQAIVAALPASDPPRRRSASPVAPARAGDQRRRD